MDGRAAEKYRYSATTNTRTPKPARSRPRRLFYVDKETGLPLRAEMLAVSSGDIKGVKAARVVAEMRDIKTDVAPALFDPLPGTSRLRPRKCASRLMR